MVRTYQQHGHESKRVGPVSSWSTEKGGKMLDESTVTLTKSQLRAILQAVGTASGLPDGLGARENFCNDEERFEESKYPNMHSDRSPSVDRKYDYKQNVTKIPSHAFHEGASSFPSGSRQALSRVEQKKRQWEKEKAESYNWSPWGRPGGGAPRHTINEKTPVYAHHESRKIHPSENCNSGLPSPELIHSERAYSGYSHLSNSVDRPMPEFLKSSVPFGPDSYDRDLRTDDDSKRRIWQEELKNQREEQKLKREEASRWYSDENGEYPESHCNHPYSNAVSPLSSVTTSLTRTYHRGQGILLNPDELSKLEEKRQKAMEYQQIIQAQVEEKRRKEREERERQRLEEEREERRLEEEREQLKKQYEEEQRKLKEKQEEKERKEKALLSAIQEAQASAEKARLVRRKQSMAAAPVSRPISSRKTESRSSECSELARIGSSKGSGLPSARDSRLETERWVASSLLSEPLTEIGSSQPKYSEEKYESAPVKPKQTVHPVQNGERLPISAPLPQPTNRELAVQTVRPASVVEEKSPYIRNRLLTPSQWRTKERNATIGPLNVWGTHREFGIQTDDENVNLWQAEDDLEIPMSSGSSVSSMPRTQQGVKTTEASAKAPSRNSACEKPKWGVNKPDKTFVKMTDRDPHYFRRKKMQDLRKQHWEREMANRHTLAESRRSVPSSKQDGTRVFHLQSSNGVTSTYNSGVPWKRDLLNTPVLDATYTIAKDSNDPNYASHFPSLHKRWSQSTDNVREKRDASSPAGALPPVRRKWRSQETFFPPALAPTAPSPPAGKKSSPDFESVPTPRRKWSDQDSFDPDRVALLRALVSCQVGDHSDGERKSSSSSDPITNPELVKKRPTPRQDKILQQLSSLRQGLLLKQKEIDSLLIRPPRTAS